MYNRSFSSTDFQGKKTVLSVTHRYHFDNWKLSLLFDPTEKFKPPTVFKRASLDLNRIQKSKFKFKQIWNCHNLEIEIFCFQSTNLRTSSCQLSAWKTHPPTSITSLPTSQLDRDTMKETQNFFSEAYISQISISVHKTYYNKLLLFWAFQIIPFYTITLNTHCYSNQGSSPYITERTAPW